MPKINFLKIFERAIKITWNRKYLWWLGFFAAMGSGSGGFLNFNFNNNNLPLPKINPGQVYDFIDKYWIFLASGFLFILLLFIFFWILGAIGQAGIIKDIRLPKNFSAGNFKTAFNWGKHYLGKILIFDIFIFLLGITVILTVAMPLLLLVYLKNYLTAIFLFIFAILFIFFPIFFLLYFLKIYGKIYLVAFDFSFDQSIEKAYATLKKNWLASFLGWLFFVVLTGFILFLITFIFFLFLGFIFIILGIVFYLLFQQEILALIFLFLFLIIILTIAIFLKAVYIVFQQAVWIFLLEEFEGVKLDEEKKSILTMEENLPSPETKAGF